MLIERRILPKTSQKTCTEFLFTEFPMPWRKLCRPGEYNENLQRLGFGLFFLLLPSFPGVSTGSRNQRCQETKAKAVDWPSEHTSRPSVCCFYWKITRVRSFVERRPITSRPSDLWRLVTSRSNDWFNNKNTTIWLSPFSRRPLSSSPQNGAVGVGRTTPKKKTPRVHRRRRRRRR